MAFEFDDNPPNSYQFFFASQPNPPEKKTADWNWLEKSIPYDGSAEQFVHWFLRFDRYA